MVDTFIRRPILASVCSLVLILAGRGRHPDHARGAVPRAGPAAGHGHGLLHRRQRAGSRDLGHHSPRAGHQRRRGHALHDVVQHQHRCRDDQRDVRHHAGSGSRADRRAEPRQPGTRPHAGGSPHHRHHGSEADDRLRDGRGRVLREGGVRLAVPEQLPGRLRQGRVEARPRRGRRADLRRAQVRDAPVARSGSHGGADV